MDRSLRQARTPQNRELQHHPLGRCSAARGGRGKRVARALPKHEGMVATTDRTAAIGRILPVPARSGGGRLTLMSEVKGRGSDLAFRLTAGRFLVMVIGCTGSEMER